MKNVTVNYTNRYWSVLSDYTFYVRFVLFPSPFRSLNTCCFLSTGSVEKYDSSINGKEKVRETEKKGDILLKSFRSLHLR